MNEALLWLILLGTALTVVLAVVLLVRLSGAFQDAGKELREELRMAREEAQNAAGGLREEVTSALKSANDTLSKTLERMGTLQQNQLEGMTKQLKEFTDSNRGALDRIRTTLDARVKELQEGNEKKLDEMRKTVDEKLQDTLERRLGESFKLVSERLEAVHKGLGEMQNLAERMAEQEKPAPPQAAWAGCADAWDAYVDQVFPHRQQADPEAYQWPGDEWGNPRRLERTFQELLVPAGVTGWKRAVELGPGSGKYTLRVLEESAAVVRAYDVSANYLEVCRQRCASRVDEGRLHLTLLEEADPGHVLRDLGQAQWTREVDAIFSLDTMVHVDLQYMIQYLLTAALVLRSGGKLVLTLADPTTPGGFDKLLGDIKEMSPRKGRLTYKFEWVAREMMTALLERLGFRVEHCDDDRRDMRLIASLSEPGRARGMEKYLL